MANVTHVFSKEILVDLADGLPPEGFVIISDDIEDTSRWSIHHKMIFKFQDRFFQTTYSHGATESQDESPYEYEGDMITVVEVVPQEKTITVYVPKAA